MPSGVKKRKAARRKKEKEANINSSRDEDFKSQNGRCFESREVNVSAVHDHHNCHSPLGGNNNKLEKNDASSVESTVDGDKSLGIERIQGNKETAHELEFEGNGVVEVENELISAENNASRNISIESIESEKKFDERDDKKSTSSSDEECNITDKKTKVYTSSYKANSCDDKPDNSSPAAIGINEFTSVGETIKSLVENTLVTGPVKSEVSVSMEKICLVKIAAAENTVVSDIVASGLKVDAETLLSNHGDGTKASSFTNLDSLPRESEDKVLAVSMENDQVSSSMMEHGSKYLEGKMRLSSVVPAVGANKDDASTKDSEIPVCSKNQTSASAPIVEQRTSLFSCCGLFDLLKGSN